MRTRPHHCPLNDSHQASMNLTHLANTFKLKCGLASKTNTLMRRIFSKTLPLYHCIAPVIAEDQNVDRRGVIGHTDSSFSGLIFPVSVRKMTVLGGDVPVLSQHSTAGIYSRVVVADGGGEPSGADPEAHHMDPFTEPGLYPKSHPGMNTQSRVWKNPRPSGNIIENDKMVTLSLEGIRHQWFQQPTRRGQCKPAKSYRQ